MRLAAAALLVAAASAHADPVTIGGDDVTWRLELPSEFSATALPELPSGRALAAYASDGRHVLVARLRINTDGAYEGKPAYFAGVEAGVERESTGYRRLGGGARKLGKHRRLPALDLWYRADGALHGARFVFLHGYVILLRLELPDTRAVESEARRLLESFGPA